MCEHVCICVCIIFINTYKFRSRFTWREHNTFQVLKALVKDI